MINNDSVVTAYDEHLTLVEWLQKIEKLLANGGLKSTALNDKGNATFSLTLTFNDDTTITSPDMTLTSVNEALTTLTGDVTRINGFINQLNTTTQYLMKNKGVLLHLPISEMEGVRLAENLDIANKTLIYDGSVTLDSHDYEAVRNIMLEAIRYGYIIIYNTTIAMINLFDVYNDGSITIICGVAGGNSGGTYEVELTADGVLNAYMREV